MSAYFTPSLSEDIRSNLRALWTADPNQAKELLSIVLGELRLADRKEIVSNAENLSDIISQKEEQARKDKETREAREAEAREKREEEKNRFINDMGERNKEASRWAHGRWSWQSK